MLRLLSGFSLTRGLGDKTLSSRARLEIRLSSLSYRYTLKGIIVYDIMDTKYLILGVLSLLLKLNDGSRPDG